MERVLCVPRSSRKKEKAMALYVLCVAQIMGVLGCLVAPKIYVTLNV